MLPAQGNKWVLYLNCAFVLNISKTKAAHVCLFNTNDYLFFFLKKVLFTCDLDLERMFLPNHVRR